MSSGTKLVPFFTSNEWVTMRIYIVVLMNGSLSFCAMCRLQLARRVVTAFYII